MVKNWLTFISSLGQIFQQLALPPSQRSVAKWLEWFHSASYADRADILVNTEITFTPDVFLVQRNSVITINVQLPHERIYTMLAVNSQIDVDKKLRKRIQNRRNQQARSRSHHLSQLMKAPIDDTQGFVFRTSERKARICQQARIQHIAGESTSKSPASRNQVMMPQIWHQRARLG